MSSPPFPSISLVCLNKSIATDLPAYSMTLTENKKKQNFDSM